MYVGLDGWNNPCLELAPLPLKLVLRDYIPATDHFIQKKIETMRCHLTTN